MKKLISVLILAILCTVISTVALADVERYTMLDDGTVRIDKMNVYHSQYSDNNFSIPSEIDGCTVSQIAEGAIDFDDVNDAGWLGNIVFPNSITNLSGDPFGYMVRDDIGEIVVSPSHPYLATIDGSLYSKPDKRIIHAEQSSYSFSNKARIEIPDGIKTIGAGSFGSFSNLVSISMPDTVEKIEHSAFSYCDDLNTIIFSKNLKEIGVDAFSGCFGLKSISLPDSLQIIGARAFSHCSKLEQLQIPDSVTYIGEKAFHATKIAAIHIPKNVSEIAGPLGVQSITIDDENAFYKIENNLLLTNSGDEVIDVATPAERIEIPSGVKAIREGAFENYSDINEIVIPASVEEIEGYFNGTPVLIVEPDSFAEKYALDRGLAYSYIGETATNDWLND